jgi:hypothetical protein
VVFWLLGLEEEAGGEKEDGEGEGDPGVKDGVHVQGE